MQFPAEHRARMAEYDQLKVMMDQQTKRFKDLVEKFAEVVK